MYDTWVIVPEYLYTYLSYPYFLLTHEYLPYLTHLRMHYQGHTYKMGFRPSRCIEREIMEHMSSTFNGLN